MELSTAIVIGAAAYFFRPVVDAVAGYYHGEAMAKSWDERHAAKKPKRGRPVGSRNK